MKTNPSLLLIDNYDSFTYNLYDYFLQLGANCLVVRNDEMSVDQVRALPFDALVLSPGPQTPAEAGITLPLIQAFFSEKPILGVCLGHQALGAFFGSPVTKAREPVHGKTSLMRHNGHPLFAGLPDSFQVMRYHSLIVPTLNEEQLTPLAWTTDGELMAMAHRTLPLLGVQFHPESILTEYGLDMLCNWLRWIHSI